MPYIGSPAAVGFSSTKKDRFSGDNSTTGFTLSKIAAAGTDIQVFVDNIRQEPTIAYSVSGTTLTFTEAPPTGTNNVYVIHQHQALGTGPLPPQDLGTTDYIFGDDISFNSDASVINMGLDSEIKITHVHNTGILLTDSGGSPTLQLHDSNESVSSDGSKLILTSNGVAFSLPTADGTSSQVLQTNGSGTLSFATVSSSGSYDLNGEELILDADADTSITADTDDRIDIKIAGSDVAGFDASGNFHIGNGTATNDGAIHINAGSSAKNIVFEADRASDGQGLGNIQFHSAGTNVAQISGERAASDSSADMVFYTYANGGSLTERLRINDAGTIIVPSDGAAATTEVTQGLAKLWVQFNGTGTVAIADSFNTTSITDNAEGHFQVNIGNDMSNDDFSVTFGLGRIDGSGSGQLMASAGLGTGAGLVSMYNQNTSGALTDLTQTMCTIHGDLA
tara:strand:+ start:122 stop:1474 length:1353 start_codon:yes stop_codon:yes gene_type:complete